MILKLIRAFFRPQLDYASMGAGIFAGLEGQYGAATLPTPTYWTPSGGHQAQEDFMRALQAISAATDRNTGIIDPNLLQSYSQLMGIDLSGLVTAGAQAGGQYGQAGQMAQDFSAGARGRGDSIWNAASDPRSQIHDFQRQQTVDASRAADTSRGIGMGGASSGNEATSVRNFEMDWQNQQLGRQLAGNQGAAGAYGQAMNYGTMAPQLTQASAAAPVAGKTAAYGMPMDFSNQFLQAQNNMFQPGFNVMGGAMPWAQFDVGTHSGQFNQDFMRAMQQYQMMNKAQGQMNMGYDYNSGAGNPMSYLGMGGGGGGGGGGFPGV